MRRLSALPLVVLISLTLTACSSNTTSTSEGTSNANESKIPPAVAPEEETANKYTLGNFTITTPPYWELFSEDESKTTWLIMDDEDRVGSFHLSRSYWKDMASDPTEPLDPARGEGVIDAGNAKMIAGDDVVCGTVSYDYISVDGLPGRILSFDMCADGTDSNVVMRAATSDGYIEAAGSIGQRYKLYEEVVRDFKDVVNNIEVDDQEISAYKNAINNSSLSEEEIEAFADLCLDNAAEAIANNRIGITGKRLSDEETSDSSTAQAAPQDSDDGASVGEKNALRRASDYLRYTPFSYNGLVKFLQDMDKFSYDEAVYAADHCGADWNEQAVIKANKLLEHTGFSHQGLIDYLVDIDDYTQEEAEHAADSVGL